MKEVIGSYIKNENKEGPKVALKEHVTFLEAELGDF